jgi:hypothetical protein
MAPPSKRQKHLRSIRSNNIVKATEVLDEEVHMEDNEEQGFCIEDSEDDSEDEDLNDMERLKEIRRKMTSILDLKWSKNAGNTLKVPTRWGAGDSARN